MTKTRRTAEQVEAEAALHDDPAALEPAAQADALVGIRLRLEQQDIPPAQLQWLKGFLQAHLSRVEYRLVAEAYGWTRHAP
jgi:hypothetical protein